MGDLKALILAAGMGTRMESELPKVIHKCMGKPMVHYVINAAKEAGADKVCVIVGYKADEVKAAIEDEVSYAFQDKMLGTGHAVKCADSFIEDSGDTIILCGDTPLIKGDTLKKLVDRHREEKNGVTVLSAVLEDSTGYGRIVKDGAGEFIKIVEQKDATDEEKEIKEINSGMYIFDSAALKKALTMLKNDNAAGEYYLTDTIYFIKEMGMRVAAMPLYDGEVDEIRGVNTKLQLKEAEDIMKQRG